MCHHLKRRRKEKRKVGLRKVARKSVDEGKIRKVARKIKENLEKKKTQKILKEENCAIFGQTKQTISGRLKILKEGP